MGVELPHLGHTGALIGGSAMDAREYVAAMEKSSRRWTTRRAHAVGADDEAELRKRTAGVGDEIEARRPLGSHIPGEQGLRLHPGREEVGEVGRCRRLGTRRAAQCEEVGPDGGAPPRGAQPAAGIALDQAAVAAGAAPAGRGGGLRVRLEAAGCYGAAGSRLEMATWWPDFGGGARDWVRVCAAVLDRRGGHPNTLGGGDEGAGHLRAQDGIGTWRFRLGKIRYCGHIVTDWAKAVACEERVPPRRGTAAVLTCRSYTLGGLDINAVFLNFVAFVPFSLGMIVLCDLSWLFSSASSPMLARVMTQVDMPSKYVLLGSYMLL
ncbi:unnamed protein product [Triticum turgidum subsp. durum]|uniref:Uncharacterized protein n=2 Tax=Triticum TaxID=4564 RepID=A0A9R1Q7Y6_TRITD|nr:unnamed protein product [Triticum aestivum]VAH72539.1 unnamed protein product [Triticum turgidum subsp. durum]